MRKKLFMIVYRFEVVGYSILSDANLFIQGLSGIDLR